MLSYIYVEACSLWLWVALAHNYLHAYDNYPKWANHQCITIYVTEPTAGGIGDIVEFVQYYCWNLCIHS